MKFHLKQAKPELQEKGIEFCLNPECVKFLPFDQYEKDFTFNVNGKTYKTSRVIADLLSPRISNMHYTDPSCKEFTINIKNVTDCENDYFEEFLSLYKFKNSIVDSDRLPFFLQYFYELRNVEGFLHLQPDYFESATEEEFFDRIHIFSESLNGVSDPLIIKIYEDLIGVLSKNFERIDKEKFASLPKAVIADTLKNKNLRIKSEDSLLKFALDLYKKDHSYSCLFEFILFSQVSDEIFAELISEIKVKYMNDQLFQSICKRFFNKQEKVDAERYIYEEDEKKAPLTYGW